MNLDGYYMALIPGSFGQFHVLKRDVSSRHENSSKTRQTYLCAHESPLYSEGDSSQVSMRFHTVLCSSVHSSLFSTTHDSHNPCFAQSISFILWSVSRGLYTPSSAIAGWMTRGIQVSANTSVQAMCGVAAGVNRIGVKWVISRFMRAMHVSASAGERTWTFVGVLLCGEGDAA